MKVNHQSSGPHPPCSRLQLPCCAFSPQMPSLLWPQEPPSSSSLSLDPCSHPTSLMWHLLPQRNLLGPVCALIAS